jgi:hypothetical protein
MSATSTASRDNGRVSGGWLRLAQQQVERTGHLADRLDGDARVKRRRVELLVSERLGEYLRRGNSLAPALLAVDDLGCRDLLA